MQTIAINTLALHNKVTTSNMTDTFPCIDSLSLKEATLLEEEAQQDQGVGSNNKECPSSNINMATGTNLTPVNLPRKRQYSTMAKETVITSTSTSSEALITAEEEGKVDKKQNGSELEDSHEIKNKQKCENKICTLSRSHAFTIKQALHLQGQNQSTPPKHQASKGNVTIASASVLPGPTHTTDTIRAVQLEDILLEELLGKMDNLSLNNATNNKNIILRALRAPDLFDKEKRVVTTIIFEGERYEALVDTGATDSCIRRDIAEKHKLNINPVEGVITLVDQSITIPRTGRTDNIELQVGIHYVSAPLEVIDQQYPFTIGIDLFHRFGLGITGLPDPGADATTLPDPEPDHKPTLIPGVTPKEEKSAKFIKEKEKFLKDIEQALKENEQVPVTSHCPVPEMKVFLPVPEGTVLFRRPRPFAEKQLPIFDEAIEKWKKDDVITLAPVGNVHNNSLTLAAKKDAEGNKTLWRVCLDPRPLNKHLPDDNYPLPRITDILNRLSANAVYSTIDLTQAYHRLPIHKEDQPLTAFMHKGTQYMFKKAPFWFEPLVKSILTWHESNPR
jgi:hypothetical protein